MKHKWNFVGMGVGLILLSFSFLSLADADSQRQPATKKQVQENNWTIDGEHMKAFLIAWSAFQNISDLDKSKKKLDNYNILISSDVKNFYVIFQPKPIKISNDITVLEEQLKSSRLGSDSPNGRWVSYSIRRKDYKIVKRYYTL